MSSPGRNLRHEPDEFARLGNASRRPGTGWGELRAETSALDAQKRLHQPDQAVALGRTPEAQRQLTRPTVVTGATLTGGGVLALAGAAIAAKNRPDALSQLQKTQQRTVTVAQKQQQTKAQKTTAARTQQATAQKKAAKKVTAQKDLEARKQAGVRDRLRRASLGEVDGAGAVSLKETEGGGRAKVAKNEVEGVGSATTTQPGRASGRLSETAQGAVDRAKDAAESAGANFYDKANAQRAGMHADRLAERTQTQQSQTESRQTFYQEHHTIAMEQQVQMAQTTQTTTTMR
jgi:hypothetical protein